MASETASKLPLTEGRFYGQLYAWQNRFSCGGISGSFFKILSFHFYRQLLFLCSAARWQEPFCQGLLSPLTN
jgi:hypothetical protein